MSDSQNAWAVVWDHAQHVSGPFEVEDVVLPVAVRIGKAEDEARGVVDFLLVEAGRMADGQQFFRVEGSAVVPQPEFYSAVLKGVSADQAYPFEM